MPPGLCSGGMFGITTKKLPGSRLEIKGAVPAEEFKSYRSKAVAELGSKIKLDGFRPGHVPEKVLVEKLGEGVILEEMAELALAKAYPEILKSEKIDALDRPEIKITKMAMGDDLAFTIETDVYPEVKLPDYKKIIAELTPLKAEAATDDEVNKVVDELLASHADHLPKQVEGESLKLTDELVSHFGEFTNAKELTDRIRQNLTTDKEWKVRDKNRVEIIKKIAAAMEVELPQAMIAGELDKMMAELKGSIERSGFPFEDYLKQINKTEVDLRGAWDEQAKERIKFGLFTNALSEAEKLYPDEAKLAEAVAELKKDYPDVAEARLKAYAGSALANDAVWEKLEDLTKK